MASHPVQWVPQPTGTGWLTVPVPTGNRDVGRWELTITAEAEVVPGAQVDGRRADEGEERP